MDKRLEPGKQIRRGTISTIQSRVEDDLNQDNSSEERKK